MPTQRIDLTIPEQAHLTELAVRLDQARKTIAAVHGVSQYTMLDFVSDPRWFTVITPDGAPLLPTQAIAPRPLPQPPPVEPINNEPAA
jgi:hypothetical protein